jgi:hypothetical protein
MYLNVHKMQQQHAAAAASAPLVLSHLLGSGWFAAQWACLDSEPNRRTLVPHIIGAPGANKV